MLQETRDRQGFDAARRQLIEMLTGYSSFQHYDTRIIFDAYHRATPAACETVTRNLSICYTNYRETADTYIERTCARFRDNPRKFDQRLIVATSDTVQGVTVKGYGAEWISALHLLSDLEAIGQRIQKKQRSKSRSTKRMLSSRLDPIAQQRLTQMRFGLVPKD